MLFFWRREAVSFIKILNVLHVFDKEASGTEHKVAILNTTALTCVNACQRNGHDTFFNAGVSE